MAVKCVGRHAEEGGGSQPANGNYPMSNDSRQCHAMPAVHRSIIASYGDDVANKVLCFERNMLRYLIKIEAAHMHISRGRVLLFVRMQPIPISPKGGKHSTMGLLETFV